MDLSQFDKYGTGPLREKALADYLESLDGDDNGTPGGTPTFDDILQAAGNTTERPIYSKTDFNVLDAAGTLMSGITQDSDGGVVTVKDKESGFSVNLHAPTGMTANRDIILPNANGPITAAGGLISTWVDTDGFEWGIVGVTTSGGLITEKVTVDAGAGTARSWVDDNGDRWTITGIGTDGHLITSKI